jgi:ubiquinone/menaquinone biosynthesis C-methylase UbiE
MQDDNLKDYYSKRAKEYDSIYERNIPARLKEQDFIGNEIQSLFLNKTVLEIACGTGFWTKYLIGISPHVVACDISPQMLEIAQHKITDSSFQFLIGDAYNPPKSMSYTGAMAHFWFSHVPKNRIASFLSSLHAVVEKNSPIMFVDNMYRSELGGKLIHKDGNKDTWKQRISHNQERFDIIKNYYTKKNLVRIFSPYTDNLSVSCLSHFWIVKYNLSK